MSALFWTVVSVVAAFIYASGAIAYWHATSHETTGRGIASFAVSWFGVLAAWIAYAAVTTDYATSAQGTASLLIAIFGTISVWMVMAYCWSEDVPVVAFMRAVLWPLSLVSSVVVAAAAFAAVVGWHLAVIASKGPEAWGRSLAALNPEVRRARRAAELAERQERIAELEKELGYR